MTQHCDDMIPALVRAGDGSWGELSAQEQAALTAHLATCAACAESLADQQAMRQALVTLADTPQSTYVGTRVMAELRAARPAATWLDSLDWQRWTWRLVPVAAALAIVVGSVAQTTATEAVVAVDATTGLPASSTLVTGEVGGTDLLSLLLNASADSTLAATGGGGQQ
jgi:anti-sigma factor RsiW